MPIMVNLDVVMAQRKMTLSQLSEQVDITLANLSILKNNKAKAVRFSTPARRRGFRKMSSSVPPLHRSDTKPLFPFF